MKKISVFLLLLMIMAVFSVAVISEKVPKGVIKSLTKEKTLISPKLDLERTKECATVFYDEAEDVWGACRDVIPYTHCTNVSGPDSGCSVLEEINEYQCVQDTIVHKRSREECKYHDNLLFEEKRSAEGKEQVIKKKLDFSDFGPCIYEKQNSCLIVTCVSKYDGAHNGEFTDCKGGKSCQRFEVCENNIKTFYKNSREDFVEHDPSFYLPKLGITEVSE